MRKLRKELKLLQDDNDKMKRIIKKKKYDEKDGEFHIRKLVAMQKTALIKYAKHHIFPSAKSVWNELFVKEPAILEKCFAHLGVRGTSDQQALREDVCAVIKYSLCQKRKYVKERLRIAFQGNCCFREEC